MSLSFCLRPEVEIPDVNVFLAEDNAQKRDDIIASLAEYGMAHTITIATTLDEAHEFIDGQQPHALTANLFLLDGNLSPTSGFQDGWQLANKLCSKYRRPNVMDTIEDDLIELGLDTKQQQEVLALPNKLALLNILRLQKEALIIGTSSVPEGKIDTIAQFPRVNYKRVGERAYENIQPKAKLDELFRSRYPELFKDE